MSNHALRAGFRQRPPSPRSAGAPNESPRGGCRRAQFDLSHFAKYSDSQVASSSTVRSKTPVGRLLAVVSPGSQPFMMIPEIVLSSLAACG
jgi:hypothetical protein